MMEPLRPKVPSRLAPLAQCILSGLQAHPEAGQIILGGGVALQHYCEFRDTRDIDAWWMSHPDPATDALIESTMSAVGERYGLQLKVRKWGETQSYELEEAGRTQFSFQIAVRTRSLDTPIESHWAPVQIESFLDNIGSKMNAVVSRGAPRDFLDVFEVAQRKLATTDELWATWQRKNPEQSAKEASLAVLRHLELLEARRPLASIEDAAARRRAEVLRRWVRHEFCEAKPQ